MLAAPSTPLPSTALCHDVPCQAQLAACSRCAPALHCWLPLSRGLPCPMSTSACPLGPPLAEGLASALSTWGHWGKGPKQGAPRPPALPRGAGQPQDWPCPQEPPACRQLPSMTSSRGRTSSVLSHPVQLGGRPPPWHPLHPHQDSPPGQPCALQGQPPSPRGLLPTQCRAGGVLCHDAP